MWDYVLLIFNLMETCYDKNNTVEGLSKSEPKRVVFICERNFFYFRCLIV